MLTLDAIQANGRRADDVAFQMMAEPIPCPAMADLDVEVLVPDGGRYPHGSRASARPARGVPGNPVYDRARLDERWAQSFLRSYVALARSVASKPQASLSELRRLLVV
jgi:hypothetical protein